jgi:hypothetical protein
LEDREICFVHPFALQLVVHECAREFGFLEPSEVEGFPANCFWEPGREPQLLSQKSQHRSWEFMLCTIAGLGDPRPKLAHSVSKRKTSCLKPLRSEFRFLLK